jgi:hypothetical protein
MPKNGTGGGGGNGNANNQGSNFFRLESVVTNYNSLNPTDLPSPSLAGAVNLGAYVVSSGGLLGFDYAVLHYGKGPGGIGQGGGVHSTISTASARRLFPQ